MSCPFVSPSISKKSSSCPMNSTGEVQKVRVSQGGRTRLVKSLVERGSKQEPVAIVTIDTNGIIVSANPFAFMMFGYSSQDLVGSNVNILIPPPYKESHDTYIRRYKATGEKNVIDTERVVEGQTKSGEVFPLCLSVKEVIVDNQQWFVGTMRKVQRLNPVIEIDRDGILKRFSKDAERIFGYAEPMVLGRNVNILMPMSHASKHDMYLAKYRQTGKRHVVGITRNVLAKHRDGSLFPICLRVEETETGFIAAVTPVKGLDLMMTVDQDGIIKACSASFTELLFGYPAEVIIDRPINFLLPHFNQVFARSSVSGGPSGSNLSQASGSSSCPVHGSPQHSESPSSSHSSSLPNSPSPYIDVVMTAATPPLATISNGSSGSGGSGFAPEHLPPSDADIHLPDDFSSSWDMEVATPAMSCSSPALTPSCASPLVLGSTSCSQTSSSSQQPPRISKCPYSNNQMYSQPSSSSTVNLSNSAPSTPTSGALNSHPASLLQPPQSGNGKSGSQLPPASSFHGPTRVQSCPRSGSNPKPESFSPTFPQQNHYGGHCLYAPPPNAGRSPSPMSPSELQHDLSSSERYNSPAAYHGHKPDTSSVGQTHIWLPSSGSDQQAVPNHPELAFSSCSPESALITEWTPTSENNDSKNANIQNDFSNTPNNDHISYQDQYPTNRERSVPVPSPSICTCDTGLVKVETFEDGAEWTPTGSFANRTGALLARHSDGSLFKVRIRLKRFRDERSNIMYSVRVARGDVHHSDYAEGNSIPRHLAKGSSGTPDPEGNMLFDRYEVINLAGEGGFAMVYHTYDRLSNEHVALKAVRKDTIPDWCWTTDLALGRVPREVHIQKLLDHPNICPLRNVISCDDYIYLVMPWGQGGDLHNWLVSGRGTAFTETEARSLFKQMLSAVHHCHNLSFCHRDIKAENLVFLDKEHTHILLIDFGSATFISERATLADFCGTASYASPEILLGKQYSGPEVDVWSLGVVLHCMVLLRMPFQNTAHAAQGLISYSPEDKLSPELENLLFCMLKVRPSARITLQDIWRHPWLKEPPPKDNKSDVDMMSSLPHSGSHPAAHLQSGITSNAQGKPARKSNASPSAPSTFPASSAFPVPSSSSSSRVANSPMRS